MEIDGTAELGHWTPFPDGYFVRIEPTTKARHFHVKVTDKPKRRSVRHRKHTKRVDFQGEKSA